MSAYFVYIMKKMRVDGENACTARNVETAGPVLPLLHANQCRKSKTAKTETKYKAARRE